MAPVPLLPKCRASSLRNLVQPYGLECVLLLRSGLLVWSPVTSFCFLTGCDHWWHTPVNVLPVPHQECEFSTVGPHLETTAQAIREELAAMGMILDLV